jgi:sulfur carrier protein ThiS
MKIQIESLGLPTLSKIIGKTYPMETSGGTVADLVSNLVNRVGPRAGKILLDQSGNLDLSIQIMINEEGFLPRDEYGRRQLRDGDRIKFMLLVGGG